MPGSLDGSAPPGNAECDPGVMLWDQSPSLWARLTSRGTLEPWQRFAAVPAGSICAGPGGASRIPCEEPERGTFLARGRSWEEDIPGKRMWWLDMPHPGDTKKGTPVT
ncbi:unnamed protein product [Coccothraustes coccothraustes]